MPTMTIHLELIAPGGNDEVELDVEFSYSPGLPETPPSYSHGGLPADPPEVEIQHIYWPYEKPNREKQMWVKDHLDCPLTMFPDSVLDGITEYIHENYQPEDDQPDWRER